MPSCREVLLSVVMLLVALARAQSAFAETAAVAFADLGNHPEAKPAVARMVTQGIMRGVSAAQFAPDAPMTRGDFVVALQHMFKLPVPSQRVTVTDVPPGSPVYDAVQAAQPFLGRELLCFGCALGANFLPDQPITCAEETMALARVLIARNKLQLLSSADTANVLAGVKDVGWRSDPAAPYFATAIKGGVVSLGADGTIGLATLRTRVDVATTLDSIQQKFAIPQVKSAH